MSLRLIIIVLIMLIFSLVSVTLQQIVDGKPSNRIFNRRLCPPQLDRTVFKCVRQYLIDVPHYIHSQTQLLDLSGNQLTILHESNFANLQRLIRLVLDDNKIWKITQNTFLPLSRLTELSMRNNHLSIEISNSVTAKILAPLKSLQRLDLSYNPLEKIPDELFVNSSTINCLIIDSIGNPLKLSSRSFQYLPKLELLSLEENQLSTLPNNIFQHQSRLDINNIRLSNNPWNCNCSLRWLRLSLGLLGQSADANQFSGQPVISHKKHNPSCFYPLQFKGFPMFQVPLDQFQCRTRISVSQSNLTAVVGSDITLVCEFYFAEKENSTIIWYHNNRRIVPSSRVPQRSDHTINISSILNISSVMFHDAGMYQCQIRSHREVLKENIYLSVLKSPDDPFISGIRIIFTVGTILASLIIVIVAILAIIYLIKHRFVFCYDDGKFNSTYQSKPNESEIREGNRNISQTQSLVYSPPAIDSPSVLISCPSKEYMSLQRSHSRYSNEPCLFLSKPAFECAHEGSFIIKQAATFSRDHSYEDTVSDKACDTCISSDTENPMDLYSKCPIHGQQVHPINQNSIIDDKMLHRPANNSVNINCPLHGYKSENVLYYELSNDYK